MYSVNWKQFFWNGIDSNRYSTVVEIHHTSTSFPSHVQCTSLMFSHCVILCQMTLQDDPATSSLAQFAQLLAAINTVEANMNIKLSEMKHELRGEEVCRQPAS